MMLINLFILIGIVVFYFKNMFYTNKHYVHMLQLNSYKNERYIRWIKTTYKPYLPNVLLGLILFILILIVYIASDYFIIALVLALAYFFCASFKRIKLTEKKKFVITQRVKRLFVSEAVVVLLFFCLSAVFKYYEQSVLFFICVAVLIILFEIKVFLPLIANIMNHPLESLINRSYYNDAKRILQRNKDLKIIGITGSYGKTSTKFILSRILSVKYNVLMTPESYNTTLGVIRTIRESLLPIHEVFVVEMGAKKKNDIKEICDLVKPKYGILSSIGAMHLETFGSIENVIKTKYELVDSLPSDGIAFLNIENKFINDKKTEKKHISYAVNDKKADFWAEDICYDALGTSFTFCSKNAIRITLRTKLLGEKNVLNIIGACAVAITLGVKEDELSYTISMIPPIPHRLEIRHPSPDLAIIDDAYNSNPEGAKEALHVLQNFATAKKILVTPGMVELGDKEYEYNYEFGKQAAEICDFIILVGEKRAIPLYEGVKDTGYNMENCFVAKNLNEALQMMYQISIGETVVLLENDLPDNY